MRKSTFEQPIPANLKNHRNQKEERRQDPSQEQAETSRHEQQDYDNEHLPFLLLEMTEKPYNSDDQFNREQYDHRACTEIFFPELEKCFQSHLNHPQNHQQDHDRVSQEADEKII